MIETFNLTKYYNNKLALNNVNLKIEDGSIYGFLGSNGAGKTTCLSILSGIIKKSSGKVLIDKYNLDTEGNKIKKLIGSYLQDTNPFPDLTSYENMLYYSKLIGLKKEDAANQIQNFFNEFGIMEFKNIKARELSHGVAKIIVILQAFLGNPKIVILDEPISGFDPRKIILLRKFIKKMSKKRTIIISSHNLDEIDRICTHIGIINEGKMILQGKKEQIKKGRSLEKVFIDNLA